MSANLGEPAMHIPFSFRDEQKQNCSKKEPHEY